MNEHQLDTLRRRDQVERYAGVDERPIPTGAPLRFGVAKIASNAGGGGYTVTEQWYDPSGSGEWANATAPLGYVQASARDYLDRDTGAADDLVRFWEQRASGGGLEVLIDVIDTEGEEQETIVARAGVARAAAGWYDIADEGTSTLTLSEADWRGRLIRYAIAWDNEPISRPLSNTEDGVFVLDGAASSTVTIVTKSVSGDTIDVYVDGTDDGALKLQLTDNGNYGHVAFLVQATDTIEPPGS